ncbi:MAG TPA: sulfite exporter TauE/SafE family protein [Clostridia bacterium]|nr:sulfite exporter TauE/SafE family protein [Clostridia bacterium]
MDLWTALMLGLVGSLHCAGMCGPLALALPGSNQAGHSFLLGRAAYNLGRLITYSLIGLVFGLAGQTLLLAGIQRWVSIAMGILLIAGLSLSRKLSLWKPVTILVNRLKASMSGLLRQRSPLALGALGLLNGLLPCGLVYVAAAASLATGNVFSGAIYMAVFGAGTLPMMAAISLSGKLVPTSLRLQLTKAIPFSVLLVATLLILRGLSLGIPYVSPDLTGNAADCCHEPAAPTATASEAP